MRLIDADDLLNELTSFCEQQEDPKSKDIVTTVSLFVEIYALATQPIDISVVRCKDCKHWKRQVGEIGEDYFYAFDCNKSYRDDFFCADGERREDASKTD